jgi:hypothetical protein
MAELRIVLFWIWLYLVYNARSFGSKDALRTIARFEGRIADDVIHRNQNRSHLDKDQGRNKPGFRAFRELRSLFAHLFCDLKEKWPMGF